MTDELLTDDVLEDDEPEEYAEDGEPLLWRTGFVDTYDDETEREPERPYEWVEAERTERELIWPEGTPELWYCIQYLYPYQTPEEGAALVEMWRAQEGVIGARMVPARGYVQVFMQSTEAESFFADYRPSISGPNLFDRPDGGRYVLLYRFMAWGAGLIPPPQIIERRVKYHVKRYVEESPQVDSGPQMRLF